MTITLKNKAIVLTGASRGIGRATAIRIAKENVRLALIARNQAKLTETASQVQNLGSHAIPIQGDVTDDDSIRNLVAKMLKAIGYKFELAPDGQEGIDLFRKAREKGNPFDAVIMDLTIPGGMGGKEAIKKLIEIDPDVKAIVASGYSSDPVMAEPEKYGFSGIVEKPYRIEELGELLNRIIGGKNRP